MSRILTKIPYFFLLAWGIILLFFTAFFFPFGTESDAQFLKLIASQGSWGFKDSINVHNIFSNFLYFILDSYEIRSFYGYRFLNLIYFSLLIFTLYKIIKLQFYDLKILQENIEDEKGNVTRFLIMGKKVQQPEFESSKKYITTCIFRLKSEPAALYKSLGGFATNQVNLTKLESFSVKNTFDQANFYLDLEGHIEQSGVKKALEELGFHTETLDILGVYEASTFRQK